MKLSEIKIQDLADKFTNEVMAAKYGDRFTQIDNIEDDAEMDADWEILNEKFYNVIENI